MKLFMTVFSTIFLAELGDKTQLATILYASTFDGNKWTIFAGASLALILTSALGVLAGSIISRYVNPKFVSWAAGLGFIGVGVWIILKGAILLK